MAEATWDAMVEGTPIIYQGALRDTRHRVYGSPDLLIRSDILVSLFPGCLDSELAAVPAADLGIGDCHYVVDGDHRKCPESITESAQS
ncbi:MAG: hypothetical protein OXQ32_04415, partial [bacterium]|nr:hypothetical protein [bacterium]